MDIPTALEIIKYFHRGQFSNAKSKASESCVSSDPAILYLGINSVEMAAEILRYS